MAESLHHNISEHDYLAIIWHRMKDVLQGHAMDAQAAGKSLRAHLEDIARLQKGRLVSIVRELHVPLSCA